MLENLSPHELFELDFDFASQDRVYNVSAIISPSRLELLDDADTPEKIKAAIPYSINEILKDSLEKKLTEIQHAKDPLTQSYGNVICGMVSMILYSEAPIRQYFPE